MLNEAVVKQFHAAHRTKRSGSLLVAGDRHRLRFCLQNGDLVAIDLGLDREHLLGLTLLEQHKITPELHRMLDDVLANGQAGAADFLRQQQAASDQEIDAATQAMVEEALCRVFSLPAQEMRFTDGEGVDTYDFAHSAVRLRIDAELLLRTVDARVNEDQAAQREVGGPETVLSLLESEGAVELSGPERALLSAVDGQRTIDELAHALREPTALLLRTARALLAKGLVRRIGGHASRVRLVSAPQIEPEPPPAPMPVRPPANWALRIGLLAVLLVCIGLVVVVKKYQERDQERTRQAQEINARVLAGNWKEAFTRVAELRANAQGDLSAVRRIDDLEKEVEKAWMRALAQADRQREEGELEEAGRLLANLPERDDARAFRARHAEAVTASRARAERLDEQVAEQLKREEVALAQQAIEQARPAEQTAARQRFEQWVSRAIERIGRSSTYADRVVAARLVDQVRLRAAEQEKLERARIDMRAARQRLGEQAADLQRRVRLGEVAAVTAELDRGRWEAQAAGTDLAGDLAAIAGAMGEVQAAVEAAQKAALDALANPRLAPAEAITRIDRVQQELPQLDLPNDFAAARTVLGALKDLPEDDTSRQIDAVAGLLARGDLPEPVVKQLRERTTALRAIEAAADGAHQAVVKLVSEGELETALRAANDLATRPEWRTSRAAARMRVELPDLEKQARVRREREAQLEELIRKGDLSAANALAREIGQRQLPMKIESIPSGAEVVRNGRSEGRTPLVLRLTSLERSEAVFELRLPGHQPCRLEGAEAEGGWRLNGQLERTPAATAALGFIPTATPVLVADAAWYAQRGRAAAVSADGSVRRVDLEPGGAAADLQPLYAGAVAAPDGIWFGTRDLAALRLTPGGVARAPLAVATDHAIALHRSRVIRDRRYLIAAGTDGTLRAVDDRNPTMRWQGPAGAAFAGPPAVVDGIVLAARRDGQLVAVNADDGRPAPGDALGAPVVAAWVTPTGLAGCTASQAWSWDGTRLERGDLPAATIAAAPDVMVGASLRVWVREAGGWRDVGVLPERPTAAPAAWRGHAAVPVQRTLFVLGERPFRVPVGADLLAPVVVGDRLVVADQRGDLRIYAP